MTLILTLFQTCLLFYAGALWALDTPYDQIEETFVVYYRIINFLIYLVFMVVQNIQHHEKQDKDEKEDASLFYCSDLFWHCAAMSWYSLYRHSILAPHFCFLMHLYYMIYRYKFLKYQKETPVEHTTKDSAGLESNQANQIMIGTGLKDVKEHNELVMLMIWDELKKMFFLRVAGIQLGFLTFGFALQAFGYIVFDLRSWTETFYISTLCMMYLALTEEILVGKLNFGPRRNIIIFAHVLLLRVLFECVLFYIGYLVVSVHLCVMNLNMQDISILRRRRLHWIQRLQERISDGTSAQTVCIEKACHQPLGAYIKNDSDGYFLIDHIKPGGVAHRSGLLYGGDELVEVNGIGMRGKNVEDVVNVVGSMDGTFTRTTKTVCIEKACHQPLGASIMFRSDGRVLIKRIAYGGAAHKSGLLHGGDELVDVNGIGMRDKNANDIANILRSMDGTLTCTVITRNYKPPQRNLQEKILVKN